MVKDNKKKIFVIVCILFLVVFITGTYAYFAAQATSGNVINGETAVVSFGLSLEKVTDADVVKDGVIPMDDMYAPFAAKNLCYDEIDNAVCQIYKISITNTGNTNMFLDGYLNLKLVNDDDEMRFLKLYFDGDNYCTSEDCVDAVENCIENIETCESNLNQFILQNVKTGISLEEKETFSREDDVDSLLTEDEYIETGETKFIYVMVWIHNLDEEQDDLQGVQNVFHGKVTFLSSEGNEVTAIFDN